MSTGYPDNVTTLDATSNRPDVVEYGPLATVVDVMVEPARHVTEGGSPSDTEDISSLPSALCLRSEKSTQQVPSDSRH